MVEQALQLAWHRHHIIVATPGRLVDHIRQTPNFAQQQLSRIRHLVLDEADRMLNMAFAEDLDTILDHFRKPSSNCIKKRQKKRRKQALVRMSLLDRIAQAQTDTPPNPGLNSLSAVRDQDKFDHPQTYLYSATMTKDVVKLRRAALSPDAVLVSCLSNPSDAPVGGTSLQTAQTTVVQSARQVNANTSITMKTGFPAKLAQYCLPIRSVDKPAVLDWILENPLPQNIVQLNGTPNESQTIVFCKRCQEARLVCGFLCERGHLAVPLTGRMKHEERKQTLADFLAHKARILVATDVASRGLDMPSVQFVINYSVPLSEKAYRHRIGRTARAGQPGVAVTLVTRDVAHSFLELEASIVRYLPRSNDGSERNDSPCIPRWPVPLPGPSGKKGMLSRRRLADEAWSRASKCIRTQDAERKKALLEDLSGSDYEDDDVDEHGGADRDDVTDEASTSQSDSADEMSVDGDATTPGQETDGKPATIANPSLPLTTSGIAGIQAARQTWRALAREKRKRHRERQTLRDNQRESGSKGWGLRVLDTDGRSGESQRELDDDEDDLVDTDHLRFEETLKKKYAKVPTMG
ncbi:putative ATP-dependent RNA helicase DDX47 [Fasciolopsis buskii]|uniref:Putative ATP-dependent RNA helicase DDX47 n=1 Tax=Fasciolopsis buskii TaxID=27845 RepID=A0A8E0VEX5_9TREM|nr:putative ATP-dependent RNA helicase DDX47 [Fasciolopsis buski]